MRNYLTDALGSSVALTDGSGVVQTEYTYEPSGGTTTSGAATGNTLAFTGREADGTGLYYFRARYYDPRVQRFASEDPIGFEAGDANLHSYVFNDPIDLTDPLGEFVVYVPRCDPANPGSRKFRIPLQPMLRLIFGDPCDPYSMMPGVGPLAAPGPLGGPLRRLADPFRRLVRRLRPDWNPTTRAARKISEWLGPGARSMRNSWDDLIAISRDGTRRVRFDINHPHAHLSPHSHVEVLVNGKWKSIRVYPPDVTPH